MKNDNAKVNKKQLTHTEYKGWKILRIPFYPLYATIAPGGNEPILYKADKKVIKRFIDAQEKNGPKAGAF